MSPSAVYAHPFASTVKTFKTASGKRGFFYSLPARGKQYPGVKHLPVSLRIVLESVLRHCDGERVTPEHVAQLAQWQPNTARTEEIPFTVARVVLQDFTGVPLLADLAAMRSVAQRLGQDPKKIEPLVPVDLVVDHSIMVDHYGKKHALDLNMKLEFQRNNERYQFMKWGMQAFDTFGVVPPGFGIVHQVNLEHLARGVHLKGGLYYPDTLVGTDSHTTMINGIGVVGWGVGGIEAEAAMLGQPVTLLTPDVVGVELTGRLREGVTASDLVLTITELLRRERWWASSSNSSARAPRAWPCPTAPPSPTWRPSSVPRWRCFRLTRRPWPTSRAPAGGARRWPPSRPTSGPRACSACRAPARSTTAAWSSSTWARSRPRWPAPSGRRTASSWARWRASSTRCSRPRPAPTATSKRPSGWPSPPLPAPGWTCTTAKC